MTNIYDDDFDGDMKDQEITSTVYMCNECGEEFEAIDSDGPIHCPSCGSPDVADLYQTTN